MSVAPEVKTLRSLIRGKDPLAWLVAADAVGEAGGDGDQVAAAIRRRASRVLAVCGVLAEVNRTSGRVPQCYRQISENCRLSISGGLRELTVYALTSLTNLKAFGLEGPTMTGYWRRLSNLEYVTRRCICRPDYLHRRATEIIDSIEGQR